VRACACHWKIDFARYFSTINRISANIPSALTKKWKLREKEEPSFFIDWEEIIFFFFFFFFFNVKCKLFFYRQWSISSLFFFLRFIAKERYSGEGMHQRNVAFKFNLSRRNSILLGYDFWNWDFRKWRYFSSATSHLKRFELVSFFTGWIGASMLSRASRCIAIRSAKATRGLARVYIHTLLIEHCSDRYVYAAQWKTIAVARNATRQTAVIASSERAKRCARFVTGIL